MKCKNCGIEFEEGIFCPECGTRIEENISTSIPEQSNNADLEKERLAKERAEHEAEIERQKTEQVRLEKERLELELNRQKMELEQAQQAEELRVKKEEENRQKKEAADKHKDEKKSENEGKTMAILSLICGILSLVTMGAFFVPEIFGIVFACLGKKQGKMRGQAIAGLVCSILSLVIIIAMIIVIIIFPSGSDGDLRNNTPEDTETSVVDESEAKDSEKEEIGASDEQYRDGVSDEYLSYLFQMDTEAIIQEYHEKGYEYVWLTSHVVKAPEDGMIGEPGTVDTVYLEATHLDSDGYFSITVTYGVLYCYWNENIGWKNNFEQTSSDAVFDFSAFNDTYWRVTDENRLLYLADMLIKDMPTDDQGEISVNQIDAYITFTNFDTFRYLGDFEFASENVLGKLVVIVDGSVYETDVICDYYSYGHNIGLIYDDTYDAWRINLQIDIYPNSTSIYWSSDSTSQLQMITQQEFEAALGGTVVNIQEGEINNNNHEPNSDEIVNKYGTYSVDNGIDANLEAEVGFYTEDGSDYIKMGALSYGGRYLAEFEGTLTHIDGNTYQAIEYYGNIILEITFDEWGMQVKVLSSDYDVIYMLEGYYQKTTELNLNEVG